MEHVAIMRKSWGLIPKILDGRKKIESRWSKFRITPFGKVKKGDTVYFKNSGELVTAKAEVYKVSQFENLNPGKVKEIVEKYGAEGMIAVNSIKSTIEWAKDKKYCTLIYLKSPKAIEPFAINKKGFGTGAAWIVVPNISSIKL